MTAPQRSTVIGGRVPPWRAISLLAEPIARPPLVAALEVAREIAPSGVSIRAWREPADFEAIVEVFRAARAVDGTGWEMTRDSLQADLRSLGHRPEETILLAEVGATVVAYVRAFDFGLSPDEGRVLMHSGNVHPDWRGRGIGVALLHGAQVEAMRMRAARPDPPGSTAGIHAWIFARNATAIGLLEAAGYRRLRYVIEMARPLAEVPHIDLPAGLSTRPVVAADRPAIAAALNEAMRDHRGWPALSEAGVLALLDGPTRGQLDVWQVAWDGDRVVGGVLGYIDRAENQTLRRRRGYTEGIFTVRAWRNRGVASALIARNLELLRARGMTEAALSVDTTSPTGAVALYERHGFRESDRVIIFRKDLAPAG